MDKLRKHIRESFFNPVLHFLPLLLFLVVDDFYGMFFAWKISFSFALILLLYIYLFYNRIFTWHIIATFIFISACLIATLEALLPTSLINQEIICETVILIFFAIFIIYIYIMISLYNNHLTYFTNTFDKLSC